MKNNRLPNLKRVTLQLRQETRSKCRLIKLRIQIRPFFVHISCAILFQYKIIHFYFLVIAHSSIFIPYLAVTTASVVSTFTALKDLKILYVYRIPLLLNMARKRVFSLSGIMSRKPCFLISPVGKHDHETMLPAFTIFAGKHG